MKDNLTTPNLALISIINDRKQIITLDANFLIPPDRSNITHRNFDFVKFKEIWLEPIFSTFPQLAIHEAVSEELIGSTLQDYIKQKRATIPPQIIIHQDSSLTDNEKVIRDTIEAKISPHTKYEPSLDNKDDRGEVKSLAYIATKGLLYFATHDNDVIQMIEKAEVWSTGLDNVQAIKMYELIFYLYKNEIVDKDDMRNLYRYQYYLTNREKGRHPSWGDFISSMEQLYSPFFI